MYSYRVYILLLLFPTINSFLLSGKQPYKFTEKQNFIQEIYHISVFIPLSLYPSIPYFPIPLFPLSPHFPRTGSRHPKLGFYTRMQHM